MWYLYRAVCNITQKSYVGKTSNVKKRWNDHIRTARNGLGFHLHDAIRKHGVDSFSIYTIDKFESELDAYKEESKIIDEEDLICKGYNSSRGIETTDKNCQMAHINHSVSTCRTWTDERKKSMSEKHSGSGNPFWGRKHTHETLIKISNASSNMTPEHREKIRQHHLGKRHSEKTKEKMKKSSLTSGKKLDDVYGHDRAKEIKDKIRKNRKHLKGSHHPMSKLTETDVYNIRACATDKSKDEELSKQYNVSKRTIEKIRLRYSWKHI